MKKAWVSRANNVSACIVANSARGATACVTMVCGHPTEVVQEVCLFCSSPGPGSVLVLQFHCFRKCACFAVRFQDFPGPVALQKLCTAL